ncbi:hypothetical protein QMT40_000115 [Parvibaculaceae bacterium PLY_AMNH_Bact1]|nr:hypothetical protein QMT40_000115 [Parvibaculaceae bacterium PLY_AMNH_Bact1]
MNEPYESAVASALSTLRAASSSVINEITAYPRPISGCDAQFNHLLSDRTRISDAINALQNRPFVPTPRVMEPGAASESR